MDQVSLSSTLCGLAIGTLVLCANFQFGLQTGWVSMMSMPAALLGFAWFKTIRCALTPQENVYIQSVAVAVGTGPLSFGLVGAIPAIQLLLTDEEGRTEFTWLELSIWSLGIAFMGIFTAVLLRRIIISDKQLKFPSGSAAAALIGVLHDKPVSIELTNTEETSLMNMDNDDLERNSPADDSSYRGRRNEAQHRHSENSSQSSRPDVSMMLSSSDGQDSTYAKNIIALILMFFISSIYTLLSKIFTWLKEMPLFGHAAAVYMWQVEFSPAYIGQGIIMGLPTTASMMLGAVLGWAVLVPISDKMNWAPGPIDDWQTGAQGWIMWVSLAIMVADTTVSFSILTYRAITDCISKYRTRVGFPTTQRYEPAETRNTGSSLANVTSNTQDNVANEIQENVDANSQGAHSQGAAGSRSAGDSNDYDHFDSLTDTAISMLPSRDFERPGSQQKTAIWGLVLSSILCIACIKLLFRQVPIYALILSVLISPVLSMLGIRALGETDLNPVSSIAKLTQFVFGVMVHNKPHAVLLNIVAGAITEAGAQQAGDLMQDYKTGSLLGALMTNQTIGMAVGTTWSVLISGIVYRLYTSHFPIPGKEFRIPTAYIWADCARLMTGQGLPSKAGLFSLILGTIFVGLAIFKHIYRDRPWAKWIPSGVAVGIGMYNVPTFTISRFIGGLTAYLYQRKYTNPADEVYLVILSSGMILGEGLMSVLYLVSTI